MFYNTQDAVDYGLRASSMELFDLIGLRKEFSRQGYAALEREQWNLASMFMAQSQLCREAIEAPVVMVQIINHQRYRRKRISNEKIR